VITVEKKQYGYYTCKAENKFGEAEGLVELTGNIYVCRIGAVPLLVKMENDILIRQLEMFVALYFVQGNSMTCICM
jgi:hypothetical protein